MALDKAIKSGKEHRKPYRGSKAIDRTCRNHGGCDWCAENRKHKFRDKQEDETMKQNRLNRVLSALLTIVLCVGNGKGW